MPGDKAPPEWFDDPRVVLDAIDTAIFARIERFVEQHLPALTASALGADDASGWGARAAALSLDPRAVLAAVRDQRGVLADWTQVFTPYEGCWIGGDLQRAGRRYEHIWYPTTVDRAGGLAAQAVLMIAAGSARDGVTVAYDFCTAPPSSGAGAAARITGIVGQRVHRGYALGGGPLLWVAAERDERYSLHLERVWANGQVYDVRGVGVAVGGAGRLELCWASDWRYQRLPDGAISAPPRVPDASG